MAGALIECAERTLDEGCAAVILCDYDAGTLTPPVLDWLAGLYYFHESAIEIDDLITSLFARLADTFTVKNRSVAAFR